MDELPEASVIEAASWRLASELMRRHPTRLRLTRTAPGSGIYNCLSITSRPQGPGAIHLNRVGTIHAGERFDDQSGSDWNPTWHDYLATKPLAFLERLEYAAGLPSPDHAPPTTPTTLTYRILATIAALAFKTVDTVDVEEGFIDSAGGGGPNPAMSAFPAIAPELLRPKPTDHFGEPGYRFWIVVRSGKPWLAFEDEQGLAWGAHRPDVVSTMAVYGQVGRDVTATTMEILRRLTHP